MHRITPAGAGKTRQPHGVRDRRGDHPRRCGENLPQYPARIFRAGSPPQVRGKLRNISHTLSVWGITPAGAGKTTVHSVPGFTPRDHPRRCGENKGEAAMILNRVGSPPQVRGKRRTCLWTKGLPEITPAGAGKTRHKADHDKRPEDHPRRCGENGGIASLILLNIGSPPQVRGKLQDLSVRVC